MASHVPITTILSHFRVKLLIVCHNKRNILKTTQYAAISLAGESGLVPVNYVQAVLTPTLSRHLTEEEEIGIQQEKIEMNVVCEKEQEDHGEETCADTSKKEMRERERERVRERIPPSYSEPCPELDVSEVPPRSCFLEVNMLILAQLLHDSIPRKSIPSVAMDL